MCQQYLRKAYDTYIMYVKYRLFDLGYKVCLKIYFLFLHKLKWGTAKSSVLNNVL